MPTREELEHAYQVALNKQQAAFLAAVKAEDALEIAEEVLTEAARVLTSVPTR